MLEKFEGLKAGDKALDDKKRIHAI